MYTVLIADDKEVFRQNLRQLPYFQSARSKFQIQYEARNGQEALDIIAHSQVDVVLTDIQMPILDGIGLLRRMRLGGFQGCTILLSECGTFDYAKEGILNGAFDYLLKPVDNASIRSAFDRAYDHLRAIGRPPALDQQTVDAFCSHIIAGDAAWAGVHARRIAQRHPADTATLESILKQTRNQILTDCPWAPNYIPLDGPWLTADTRDPSPAFVSRLQGWAQEFRALAIPQKDGTARKACQYILTHSEAELQLHTLADHLHLNKNYLGTLLKKELGMGFVDYLTLVKMKRAKLLLEKSGSRVFEVADAVGYSDPCYFSKVFKKITGESPCAYRERLCQ